MRLLDFETQANRKPLKEPQESVPSTGCFQCYCGSLSLSCAPRPGDECTRSAHGEVCHAGVAPLVVLLSLW